MSARGMNPLSVVLEQTLKKLQLTDAALEARALLLWPELVGEQMARASEARTVRGGVLEVTTRSSAWNQEFSFQKTHLLRRLKERLGKEVIRDIRFTVGPIRGIADPVATGTAPPKEELRRIRLSEAENERIRRASECDDPELAQAIRRALTREAQLRAWHLEHGARECPRCGAAYRQPFTVCPACRQDDATRDAEAGAGGRV